MFKTMRMLALIFGVVTVALIPMLGTWSTWYPWPPEPYVRQDFQTAIWLTWFWCGLVPTGIFSLTSYLLWWFKEN